MNPGFGPSERRYYAPYHRVWSIGERIGNIEEFMGEVDAIAPDLPYDVSKVLSEAVIDKSINNWRTQPNGQGHLENLGQNRRRPAPVGDWAVLDRYGAELAERYEKALARFEKSRKGKAQTQNIGPLRRQYAHMWA